MMKTAITVKSLAVEVIYSICQWLDSCHDLLSASLSCKSTAHLIKDQFLIATVLTNKAKPMSLTDVDIKISNVSPSMPKQMFINRLPREGLLSCEIDKTTRRYFPPLLILIDSPRNCIATIRYSSEESWSAVLGLNLQFIHGHRFIIENVDEVRHSLESFRVHKKLGSSTIALMDWCKNAKIRKQKPWGVIQTLCMAGADPNAGLLKNLTNNETPPELRGFYNKLSPLMHGILKNDVDMVVELLECGADPTFMFESLILEATLNGCNFIALILASYPYAKRYNIPIPHFLASHGLIRNFTRTYDHSGMMETALKAAIASNSLRLFSELMQESYLIHAYDPDKIKFTDCLITIVDDAANPARIAILSSLIKAGISLLNADGLLAVSKASKSLAVETTSLFVDAIQKELRTKCGADSDWASTGAEDARSHQIKAASLLGDVKSVNNLLNMFATVTSGPSTASILVAFEISILNKQKEVLKRFLQDERIAWDHIISPAILKIFVNQGPEVIEALLSSSRIELFQENGSRGQDFRILGMLLRVACDEDLPGKGNNEVARYLLEKRSCFPIIVPTPANAEPNQFQIFETCLFWVACERSNPDLAALLLENGIYRVPTVLRYWELPQNRATLRTDESMASIFRKIAPTCTSRVLGLLTSPETCNSIWNAFEHLINRFRHAEANELITLGTMNSDGVVPNMSEALLLFMEDVLAKTDEEWKEILESRERLHFRKVYCAWAVAKVVKNKNIVI
ncbi:hypothetical protein HDU97_003940 [Phlyctochytrium planicorne]|nr:hypothetical protein HDU97_003940 [Phlyctochytrium planicorne]